jgi:hypothetical protein
MTSQRNKIKACLTFNSANNGNCLIMEIQDQINSTRVSMHLTQVIPLSQPHTKLDLETISNRLNDCDIDLSLDESIEDSDIILNFLPEDNTIDSAYVFTMYKRVDKKVKPVSTTFPEECYVRRQVPVDPLLTLPSLPMHPPEFVPTKRITEERLKILKINKDGFLSSEEEKLITQVMVQIETAIAFEDSERGTFNESYFSPYIIPTVPHIPWEDKNIPIPPGLRERVMEVLKLKIDAGVYEQSQASY